MKTQILRLEPHDDYISVRDKLGWMQTGRIVLVWPPQARILQRELDLVLLQRQASAFGGQIALVTRDRLVRFHANNLGIPVFDTPEQAQRDPWRRGRRKLRPRRRTPTPDIAALQSQVAPPPPAWAQHTATRVGALTLGVLAILSLLTVFVPRAQVSLYPFARTDNLPLEIQASPEISAVEMSGLIPLRTRTVSAEARGEKAVHSNLPIPDQSAQGMLRFTNLTEHAIQIPAQTPVFAPNAPDLHFVTRSGGTLPGGIGQTLSLPVVALEGGQAGNLPPDSLTTLSGGLGAQVQVTNPLTLTGGTDVILPAPSEADRQALSADLLEMLQQTALEEFQRTAEPGDILFAASLHLREVTAEEFTPPPGQAGQTLQLTLRADFEIQVVAGADLHALAQAITQAQRRNGYRLAQDSIRITSQTTPAFTPQGEAHWRVLISWRQQADLDPEQARTLLLGQSIEAARLRLKNTMPLASPPEIELTPAWWPRLPLLPFRITVEEIEIK
ncbi:MAG: hypothetical protein Fur0018_08110 [Anaerolineales bacterium]